MVPNFKIMKLRNWWIQKIPKQRHTTRKDNIISEVKHGPKIQEIWNRETENSENKKHPTTYKNKRKQKQYLWGPTWFQNPKTGDLINHKIITQYPTQRKDIIILRFQSDAQNNISWNRGTDKFIKSKHNTLQKDRVSSFSGPKVQKIWNRGTHEFRKSKQNTATTPYKHKRQHHFPKWCAKI